MRNDGDMKRVQHLQTSPSVLFALIITLNGTIGTSVPRCCAGQDIPTDICANSDDHMGFVVSSLDYVKSGTDSASVLEALMCIALAEPGNPWVGNATVRAMFHIADENGRIQEYLLRIIRDDNVECTTRWAACKQVTWVLDDVGRKIIHEDVVRRWKEGRDNHGIGTLVTLGDPEFLSWAEETATEMSQDNPMKSFLEHQARLIRLQHDLPRLLQELESC